MCCSIIFMFSWCQSQKQAQVNVATWQVLLAIAPEDHSAQIWLNSVVTSEPMTGKVFVGGCPT